MIATHGDELRVRSLAAAGRMATVPSEQAPGPTLDAPARRLLPRAVDRLVSGGASSSLTRTRPLHPAPAGACGSERGFTLLEMLVVMLILMILAVFGFPALQELFTRSKLQGSAREISIHLGSSRIAAMRLGRNVVVRPVFGEQRLVSFVDDNENFKHDTGEQVIASLSVPGTGSDQGIYMRGPNGVAPTDEDPAEAIDGFTDIEGEDEDDPTLHLAVFEPDGSVRDPGAFRISDAATPPNVFEVRIDPPATARIQILKYVFGRADGLRPGTPAGSWFGQGGNQWEWY
jgi:prepilin-type N-terminal cleavage/methylation domain-containing protein